MLAGHDLIDRLMPLDAACQLLLGAERFDLAINLDKEPPSCALLMQLEAKTKLGIGLSPHGTPIPLNEEAVDYFKLGLSDELKFQQNTKTYPQLIFEALGLVHRGERYTLPADQGTDHTVHQRLKGVGWAPDRTTVGINVGAGVRFANKMWPTHRLIDAVISLQIELPDTQVLLLGGPSERHIVDSIQRALANDPCRDHVIDAGTDHDEQQFISVVDACDVLFTGDTMAMHVAIALGKRVVAVFGPTCHQEIDLFGQGQRLIAEVPCAPCYKRVCDHNDQCVSVIRTRAVVGAIKHEIGQLADQPLRFYPRPLRLAG